MNHKIRLPMGLTSFTNFSPRDAARCVLIAYLAPPSLRMPLLTKRQEMRDTLALANIAQETEAARCRFHILRLGGPHNLHHGKQRELCQKFHLSPKAFNREMQKARELWRRLRLPLSCELLRWD